MLGIAQTSLALRLLNRKMALFLLGVKRNEQKKQNKTDCKSLHDEKSVNM